MPKTIGDVRCFWENNPLWTGESKYEPGTKEFFEEHRQVYIGDCYAGQLDERLFPGEAKKGKVLDLGCGPGFWTVEFILLGYKNVTAADLTHNALALARRRCEIYTIRAEFTQQNAEKLAFCSETFAHVNCLGVIHHTPDTETCIKEIARVLEKGGTANISVYYHNIFLRVWPVLRWPGKLLAKLGAGLKGRGRENIFTIDDVDEIVRLYDGQDNPIGKSFTYEEFTRMLAPHFYIEDTYLYFFPARTLPFKLPVLFHRLLGRYMGFMICAKVRKR